jgi:hypothetical protein
VGRALRDHSSHEGLREICTRAHGVKAMERLSRSAHAGLLGLMGKASATPMTRKTTEAVGCKH